MFEVKAVKKSITFQLRLNEALTPPSKTPPQKSITVQAGRSLHDQTYLIFV